ncbi:MAG: aspartate-alanine antiporter [Gammaproteobacteria bacterium]|nr:aspartate-alanine antiporter [Gammaproteobacteria bacterium]MCP4276996.1 aspartate-alanine antiporter [Gammaproteobacteria bacterium]MCP4831768.1 aspartate-alanine antiporter [Gammaproteobacteria bacterium]MCP4929974.1 aspartate-alanine antiporter [Gammaproteobacteria bacterium]
MEFIKGLFTAAPLLSLFITVAIGYFVGKLKIGRFVLGGIAGTLITGVVVGQLDVPVDSSVKSIFFALFIYAVGYQGGPQFFRALNLKSLNELFSSFFMCLMGLFCVLGAAWIFDLDRGTAAGLAAGGLTQSAIIGTAGDAIAKLDLAPELIKTMQTNIAVGYAVCYIFGSLGPIIMITWFFPTIMRWDIRAEALKLEREISGGHPALEPGQFNALRSVVTRVYELKEENTFVGKTVLKVDSLSLDAAVEEIIRDGTVIELTDSTELYAGDQLVVTGTVAAIENIANQLGQEIPAPVGTELVEEQRDIVLTNKAVVGKTLRYIHDHVNTDTRHGIFITGVKRMGHELSVLPNLEIHRGDELSFIGSPKDLNGIESKVGYPITAAAVTDFVIFGIGMSIGVLLGLIEFRIGGIPVMIGTGGGCLLSGLLFGWLRSTHPRYGAMPIGTTNFLRDFGLAVFVGVVGLTAGPQAFTTIQQYGLTLLMLGVAVTLIPQVLTFFFSYYILRIKNPIELLSCTAGGRSANPGFAALMDKAGNATPVVAFTVTYAVANVFLTLWGPLIVGIITKNP